MTTVEDASYALSKILDAGSQKNVIELGWIKNVRVAVPRSIITLALPSHANSQRDRIVQEVRKILLDFVDIEDVQIELDNSNVQPSSNNNENSAPQLQRVQGIKQVIAVSSGKGGVGKSTIAVNLACSLSKLGLKTGLLDADIYGPNAPSMLGVSEENPKVHGSGNEQRLIPINKYGISIVSMGFLIEEGQPVIWRGPMLNSIIRQFLYQVEWNSLDFLIIDLPPGTGDAQISLAQSIPISGAIIVTTPQKVSLQDSRRGLAMFKQLGVPLIGVVENMSFFIPPDQKDKKYAIFGSGGGQLLADENNLPLLAQIPIEMHVVSESNIGVPISVSEPNTNSSLKFKELASLLKVKFCS